MRETVPTPQTLEDLGCQKPIVVTKWSFFHMTQSKITRSKQTTSNNQKQKSRTNIEPRLDPKHSNHRESNVFKTNREKQKHSPKKHKNTPTNTTNKPPTKKTKKKKTNKHANRNKQDQTETKELNQKATPKTVLTPQTLEDLGCQKPIVVTKWSLFFQMTQSKVIFCGLDLCLELPFRIFEEAKGAKVG